MTSDINDFVALPPAYSEADQKRRSKLLEELKRLHLEYQAQCEPLLNELAEIENKYPLRGFIAGSQAKAGNGE